MTRARRSLHVLSCFRPEDLDQDRLAHGAVDFYELLDRELSGNSNLGTPASRAVASEQALGGDPLVADLGERLRARGARVWHLYDGVLDIAAAADPVHTIGREGAEIPTPVAIESDGTERYRRMSVRERSRLRPQLLERMGWRYMSLWTIEVFTDPSACADRIGLYLGLENHIPQLAASPQHGFLDVDVEQLNLDRTPPSFTPSARRAASQPEVVAGNAGTSADNGKEAPMMEQGSATEDASTENSGEQPHGTSEEAANSKAAAAKPASDGILPTKAAEDDPRRWGDDSGYDHEEWLKEQKPPHWG